MSQSNPIQSRENAHNDQAFAAIADDREFQAKSVELAEEAMQAGWEALQVSEAEEADVRAC